MNNHFHVEHLSKSNTKAVSRKKIRISWIPDDFDFKQFLIRNNSAVNLIVFFLIMLITILVLPKLSCFSHVVDVEANPASATDAEKASIYYLEVGDVGENVVELQKALFKLKLLNFDQITGNFELNTLDAVNNFIGSTKKEYGCSYDVYERILTKAEAVEGNPAGSLTTAEAEKTSAITTQTTSPTVKMVRITASMTRIRRDPVAGSYAYYMLLEDDEYMYISQATDADGSLWYKVQYDDQLAGWVVASDAEIFDK